MPEYKVCPVCKKKFVPSKYRNDQQICSRQQCQHQRQLLNMAAWREKNPGYFKTSRHETSWAQLYRERARAWRKKHKGRIREYRQAHKEEQREYMRMYMYRYRHSW